MSGILDRTAQRLEPAKQWVKDNANEVYGSTIEPLARSVSRAAGGAASAGPEVYNAAQDISSNSLSAKDKGLRVTEGAGRIAAAELGGEAGLALGSTMGPVGAGVGLVAGGLLGAAAPNMIRDAVKKYTGAEVQFPSERASSFRGNINDGRFPDAKDYATRVQPKTAYQPQSNQ